VDRHPKPPPPKPPILRCGISSLPFHYNRRRLYAVNPIFTTTPLGAGLPDSFEHDHSGRNPLSAPQQPESPSRGILLAVRKNLCTLVTEKPGYANPVPPGPRSRPTESRQGRQYSEWVCWRMESHGPTGNGKWTVTPATLTDDQNRSDSAL